MQKRGGGTTEINFPGKIFSNLLRLAPSRPMAVMVCGPISCGVLRSDFIGGRSVAVH